MDLTRNKRLQWFLLTTLEDFNNENGNEEGKANMEELSDLGWFSNNNGGSGSIDLMEDLEDDHGCKDIGLGLFRFCN